MVPKKYINNGLVFVLSLFILFAIGVSQAEATLTCTVTTAAACTSPSVIALRMSGASNAHSELPSQSTATYSSNVVCCSGVTGLANTCTGAFVDVLDLASTSNSHAEESQFTDYLNPVCLSAPSGNFSVGYQSGNCTGYDTGFASLASSTNSHVGSSTAYTTEVCVKYLPAQSLSFSLSSNSLGFGNLTAVNARYATSGGLGTTTSSAAQTVTLQTNAGSGYTLTAQGATLTSGSRTITAIGGTNTASTPGTEQFGLHISAAGGTGTVSSPYAASGFAYAATATTSSQVASESVGDSTNTVYSVTYLANITASTESTSYTSTITYQVTGNF